MDGKKKAYGKGASKGTNTRDLFLQRAVGSILVAHHQGGWITTRIMANLFWPNANSGKKYAERLMAEMHRQDLLILRELPNRMLAGVITAKGARYAEENIWRQSVRVSQNVGIRPGTDWGKTEGKSWRPPASWQHQLRAGHFVTWIAGTHHPGWMMAFDLQIQRSNPLALKRPDGLIYDEESSQSYWIEVESARKTGPELTKLVHAFLQVDMRQGLKLQTIDNDEGAEIEHEFSKSYLVVPQGYDIEAFQRRVLSRLKPGAELNLVVAIENSSTGFDLHPLKIRHPPAPKLGVAWPHIPSGVTFIDEEF